MERNSSGAFDASSTSDHHAIISSCLLYITCTRVCSLAAVLEAAAPLTTRPPAGSAPPPLPLFSAACKSVAVLRQAMRVCSALVRSTSGGASGASQRGLRPYCGAAESGLIGRLCTR